MSALDDLAPTTLRLERHDRVLLVVMDRPHRLNAYDRAMVEELRAVYAEEVERDAAAITP